MNPEAGPGSDPTDFDSGYPSASRAQRFSGGVIEDEPYALKSEEEKVRRYAMLRLPHVAPLVAYVDEITAGHPARQVPQFDPCDGGVQARALFLLEAAGPKALRSGFISRDNPDQTARNMLELMRTAGIPRRQTLLWNVVPWYVGDGTKIRPVGQKDVDEAQPYLESLLRLLPRLELVVLVGKKAQRAAAQIVTHSRDVRIVRTYHPSPLVFQTSSEKRQAAQEAFHAVARLLGLAGPIPGEDREMRGCPPL